MTEEMEKAQDNRKKSNSIKKWRKLRTTGRNQIQLK